MLWDDASRILRDVGAKEMTIAMPKVQALKEVEVTGSSISAFSQAYLLADGTCVALSADHRRVNGMMWPGHGSYHAYETTLTSILVGQKGKGAKDWWGQTRKHAATIKVSKAGLHAVEVAPTGKKGN